MSKEAEFYQKLKEQLSETTDWPSKYPYKFIIPNQEEKKKELEAIFKGTEAQIFTKESSNGKYIAYSIDIQLPNPDAVIDYYQKVGTIDGVVSL